jgi:hypothetical protein
MIRVEANNYHKKISKASLYDEAFSFKPFCEVPVFNAALAFGYILANLLILSTNTNCKKKDYEE